MLKDVFSKVSDWVYLKKHFSQNFPHQRFYWNILKKTEIMKLLSKNQKVEWFQNDSYRCPPKHAT